MYYTASAYANGLALACILGIVAVLSGALVADSTTDCNWTSYPATGCTSNNSFDCGESVGFCWGTGLQIVGACNDGDEWKPFTGGSKNPGTGNVSAVPQDCTRFVECIETTVGGHQCLNGNCDQVTPGFDCVYCRRIDHPWEPVDSYTAQPCE